MLIVGVTLSCELTTKGTKNTKKNLSFVDAVQKKAALHFLITQYPLPNTQLTTPHPPFTIFPPISYTPNIKLG